MSQTAPIEPADVTAVPSWDDEADVVIVGLGCAGASAAIDAAEAGADVLVLERMSAGGGTSANAGGLIYMGGGTPVQRACGFDDTPDNMYRFLVAALGPDPDLQKIRAYCDDSVEHFHWFVDHGVPFKPEFFEEHDREPPTDAGLIYSGGEDAYPFSEIADPAPRGHHPQYPDSAGGFLMARLLAAVEASGARQQADHRAARLIVDGPEVVGVESAHAGETTRIRARGGVVLAAGGFIFNEAMVAEHCPEALRCLFLVGTDGDDGSGIRMGMGTGAATRALDVAECAIPLMPPRGLARGLLVNGHGRRFINEDTYGGRIGQHALFEQGGHVFWIGTEEVYEVNPVGMRIQWAAETAAELAGELGLPVDAFVDTLQRYNDAARLGHDPEHRKDPSLVVPLDGPLGAIDLRVESSIYAPFTLGGLETDVDGRVRHVDGHAIPGLYAAGRTSAGLSNGGYASGISLGDGTYFGRRAGRHASRRR